MRLTERCELLAVRAGPRSVSRPPGVLWIFDASTLPVHGDFHSTDPYDSFEVGHAEVSRVYPNDERLVTSRVDNIALIWLGTGTINFTALVARIIPTGTRWHPDVNVDVKLYDWFVMVDEVFMLGSHMAPMTRPTPKVL